MQQSSLGREVCARWPHSRYLSIPDLISHEHRGSGLQCRIAGRIVKDALNRVDNGYYFHLINTLIALSVEPSNLAGPDNSDPIFFLTF